MANTSPTESIELESTAVSQTVASSSDEDKDFGHAYHRSFSQMSLLSDDVPTHRFDASESLFMHSSHSSLSLAAYGQRGSRRMSSWADGEKMRGSRTQSKLNISTSNRLNDLKAIAGAKIILVPKVLPEEPGRFEEIEVAEKLPLVGSELDDHAIPDTMYAVQKLSKRDDELRLRRWQRFFLVLSPYFSMVAQILVWFYMSIRVILTIRAQRVAGAKYPMAWIFLAIECILIVPDMLFQFWQLSGLKRRKRPQLRLLGDDVPTVDLFVTTCGEEASLVMDTVRAACDVDYPLYSFRVVVLDDGGCDELRQLVEVESARRFPNLFYHARKKVPGKPHHFKAGNLNGGLEFTKTLPGGAGEFMAALDADMLPSPDLLRCLVAPLLMDTRLAMTCPPQLFYNVPDDDILCQSLEVFVHISEPLKDSLGVAWCTGSGYCVRRAALDDIGGGFPYGSLAEDVCFSSMLLGRGWRCMYVHEPLQYGTVPDSFEGHIKQRTRWVIGTIQTAQKLNWFLWGKEIRKMTIYQRACGLLYSFSACFSILLTIALFTVPIVLLSSGTMIAYTSLHECVLLLRLFFMSLMFYKITECINYAPLGWGHYHTGRRNGPTMVWMAPFYSYCIIRSFLLPKWIAGPAMGFKPSGSTRSDLNERDKDLRAGLWTRMRVILWNNKVIFHLIQLTACVAGVIYSTTRCIQYKNKEKLLGCMLQNAWWPPLPWLLAMSSSCIPLYYMIFPPDCPDRELLLTRDDRGIAQPTERAKETHTTKVSVAFEMFDVIAVIYTSILFGLSFFITDAYIHWRD